MRFFDIVFVLNFLLTLYQFFVLDIKQDNLGGFFGTHFGCNAYTNVFLMVVITLSIIRYMNQHESAWLCLAKCGLALLIAAMAELKMFILEFVMIVVLAILLTKFSRRKIFLLVGAGVGVILGIQIMIKIFPGWANWFNIQSIWETAISSAGYTGQGDWKRLTAVPIAWNTFLTTWPQKLFGLGLGNCDFGPIAAMTSPFYIEYFQTNYYSFSSGIIMLETGLIGMIVYLMFFVMVFIGAHKLEISGQGNVDYCQFAKIMSLMCFVLFLYNCTLRIEIGYMVYFSLALPFIEIGKSNVE